MWPTLLAIVMLIGVAIATFETWYHREVMPPEITHTPRAIFIDRLRATGTIAQRDYATILELTEPRTGETALDLSQGYRVYLAQLPRH